MAPTNIHIIYQHTRKGIEIISVGAIVLCAFFLLKERIECVEFPSGDEGSWMSVASQIARGEGFTTRWYEHPFLKYPMLPRPDDYRYPALTNVLAFTFKIFGTTYSTALWTVCFLYLVLLILIYLIVRRISGVAPALMVTALSAVSLLQLYWNSAVYSEGLYGIALAFVIASSLFLRPDRIRSWVVLGIMCGLLFYVRPNGILFTAGFLIHPILQRNNRSAAARQALVGLVTFLFIVSPWLMRNWLLFENPFHIAGGAGVLRGAPADPFSWSLSEFLGRYSPFFFIKATVAGTIPFFSALRYFEKNLFILPVLGILIGLIRRRPFYTPFIATGFLLSIPACFYISYTQSWAGVRYASSLLPFLYAYGTAELVSLCHDATRSYKPVIRTLSLAGLFSVLLMPVYYPHRYYQRFFSTAPKHDRSFAEHVRILDSLVPAEGYYLADNFGQCAFLTKRNCAGIQTFFDSTMVAEYLQRYSPAILVVREIELGNSRIRSILREIGRRGYGPVELRRTKEAIYYGIAGTSGDTERSVVR